MIFAIPPRAKESLAVEVVKTPTKVTSLCSKKTHTFSSSELNELTLQKHRGLAVMSKPQVKSVIAGLFDRFIRDCFQSGHDKRHLFRIVGEWESGTDTHYHYSWPRNFVQPTLCTLDFPI